MNTVRITINRDTPYTYTRGRLKGIRDLLQTTYTVDARYLPRLNVYEFQHPADLNIVRVSANDVSPVEQASDPYFYTPEELDDLDGMFQDTGEMDSMVDASMAHDEFTRWDIMRDCTCAPCMAYKREFIACSTCGATASRYCRCAHGITWTIPGTNEHYHDSTRVHGINQCVSCQHTWNVYSEWVDICSVCGSSDIMAIE